jgi:Putative transmembrane family 234
VQSNDKSHLYSDHNIDTRRRQPYRLAKYLCVLAQLHDISSTPLSIPIMTSSEPSNPSPFTYILSFLIVGLCWGFTTPFIRRAALTYTTPTNPSITDPRRSWLTRQLAKAFFIIVGLLKSPGYAIPLLCNLTGSVWFFLLVGKAGESLFPML